MSKQIITGTVEKVFAKEKAEDQWGNKYFLSAKIGDTWVGFGGKKQDKINYKEGQNWKALQEGDVVEVVAETNAKGYLQAKSSDITVKESGNGQSRGSTSSGSGAGANKPNVSPVSNDNRQDSIMRQSAMGYAAAIVSQTLTSKSNLDQAAAEVVRIADEHFLPYAKNGRQEERVRMEQEQGQQAHQAEEDFDDSDVPF